MNILILFFTFLYTNVPSDCSSNWKIGWRDFGKPGIIFSKLFLESKCKIVDVKVL